jgi:hypothetical protein
VADATGRGRARRTALLAGAAYLAVSFAYFGIPVLPHLGRDLVGDGGDPQLFVWSLAWWPHAILHGHNPFVSHALWAPSGADLAWSTSIPGLALLLAPVTLAAGPVVAYNVAAVLLPALAATTAFLLCRHVTRSFWPSLAGGYLFGFSSYMLGHELGHLHLTSVFLVPLAVLVVLRFLEGELDAQGLVVRLGPLLAFQFAFGTEVFFMLALSLAAGLAVGVVSVPARRHRLFEALLPLAGAYAVCAALVSPLLYYAVTGYQGVVTPTGHNPADAVTFAFPTGMTAVGGRWAQHFDPGIALPSAEDGQYLGLAALAIVTLFAASRWRRSGSRFLVIAFALACLATLGSELRIRGHDLFPLPWRLVRSAPLFDNVIPGRFALFVSLIVSLIVALWAASPATRRSVRVGLTALAVLAIVPRLGTGVWHQHPQRPSFFAGKLYRSCIRPGETVLMLPPPFRNEALLWQAESGFRFALADGGLNDSVPHHLQHRATMLQLIDNNVPPGGPAELLALARAHGVSAILVAPAGDSQWTSVLDSVLAQRTLGGLAVYRLSAPPARCGQA